MEVVKKKCVFCKKTLRDMDDKYVMHSECFEEYKKIDKTPETYIMMFGAHKGKRFNELDEKYLDSCMSVKPTEKSPMFYFQKQITYFRNLNKPKINPITNRKVE